MTIARFAVPALSMMLLTAQTCPSNLTGPIPPSEWGGLHIGMVVSAVAATVEYDCATGTIDEPINVDSRGRFTAKGTHTRGHGGPVMIGETPDPRPASYSGSTDGTSMTVSVTLTESGQTLGPFTLARGASPAVLKCV